MISNRSPLLVSAALAVSLCAASGTAAQTGPERIAVAAADTGAEDIIVTAQKREQTLIDVPQSVSVIGGATLERQQANNFQDYLKLVPGLQLNQDTAGQGRLVVRGVNTGGVAATVAVYVDETPFGSSSGLVNGSQLAGDFDIFDVARIEVLRGPQGTFYGASSLGGVLKFVTNLPEIGKLSVRGRGGVEAVKGGDTSYFGNAVVNVPLGSTLAIRASGYYRKDGGFIDSIGTAGSDVENDINGSRNYGGRASLLFKPSDTVSLRLSAVVQNIEADSPNTVESDPDTLKTLYGRPTRSQFVPSTSSIRYRVYNATANFDLGFADLTSSSSYSTQKLRFRDDATTNLSGLIEAIFGTPNELFLAQRTESEKYTQEVRLASSAEGFLDWLIGGYYTNEKGLISQQYVAVVPRTLTPITTLPLLADVSLNSKYEEIAGFANATLHLGERFDIDLGGRYSHNKQSALQAADGALAGGPNILPRARSSENVFTYSIAPKLKFGERASIYGRVAKGFRPGGPNVLPPNPPAGTPTSYQSDSLLSYEIGVKAETPDRMFSIEADVYHIDWKDIQLLAVVNGFGLNVNAGSAKVDGATVSASFRPAGGVSVSVNGAYTDARLKDDTGPLVGGIRGDGLPFTPKYSVGVNGDYEWPLGGAAQGFVGASLRFLSKQPGAFDNDFRTANGRQRELPSYDVVDLRAGVNFGRFTVEAYVKNLGNSQGKTSTTALTANGFPVFPNGAIGTGLIRPRTIGLTVGAGF